MKRRLRKSQQRGEINKITASDSALLIIDTINEIVLNGVRYSFLPVEEKQAMEAAFSAEMTQLRQTHGL